MIAFAGRLRKTPGCAAGFALGSRRIHPALADMPPTPPSHHPPPGARGHAFIPMERSLFLAAPSSQITTSITTCGDACSPHEPVSSLYERSVCNDLEIHPEEEYARGAQ
jgi:hypothetical protein